MKKSKLIQTIKVLSAKQLNRLEELLESPFFVKKSEDLLQFYRIIKTHAPEFESDDLEKATLFAGLYPDEAYNEGKINYLMNQLLEQVERFIIQLQLEADKSQQLNYLMEAYIEHGLEKNYKRAEKQFRNTLQHYSGGAEDYHYDVFQLHYLNLIHTARRNQRAFDQGLQSVADSLDNYYLVEKLKICCEMISRKQIIASGYQPRFLNEILRYLEDHPMDEVPAIGIYHKIILLMTDSERVSHFDELKELLNMHADRYSVEEARQMYLYTLNFCIRQYNDGNKAYLREIFDLHKVLLTKDLLLVNGQLSPWRFKNIVTNGIKLKEFTWTEKFMQEYKEKLPAEHKENSLTYNLAHLHFGRKNYDASLDLLRDVEFNDVFLNVDTKSLLIKIYYEQQEFDALYHFLESFRMYLRRNKVLSESYRTIYLNFIRFVRKLMRIHHGAGDELQALRKKFDDTKSVAHSEWLSEMMQMKLR